MKHKLLPLILAVSLLAQQVCQADLLRPVAAKERAHPAGTSPSIRAITPADIAIAHAYFSHDSETVFLPLAKITIDPAKEPGPKKVIAVKIFMTTTKSTARPLTVIPYGNDGSFRVIEGNAKFRAAQKLGLKFVPVYVITDEGPDQEIMQQAGKMRPPAAQKTSPQPQGPHRYYIMNKPAAVLSEPSKDGGGRIDVYDVMRKNGIDGTGCYVIGRLDYDVEGLTLITDDDFNTAYFFMPCTHLLKTYRVVAEGQLGPEDIERLQEGVPLRYIRDNGNIHYYTSLPAIITILPDRSREASEEAGRPITVLHLSIMEGKYHQVKHMMEAVGHPIVHLPGRTELRRVQIGPLCLPNDLPPGQCRALTKDEVAGLMKDSRLAEKKLTLSLAQAPREVFRQCMGMLRSDIKGVRALATRTIERIAKFNIGLATDELAYGYFDSNESYLTRSLDPIMEKLLSGPASAVVRARLETIVRGGLNGASGTVAERKRMVRRLRMLLDHYPDLSSQRPGILASQQAV